ncbi:MAG TPA: hypothetical protein VKW77_00755, partial [Acidimicrobiales bacterium]|nr:hypothetical protein [Acidimicrobiales bacterium]
VVRGRLVGAVDRHVGGAARAGARAPGGEIGWVASLTSLPLLGAAALSVLLVFIAFGITEPFITNGYADPIWSLAALGALVYGLQLPASPGNAGVAAVLLAVAGMGKNEGAAAAVVIVLLVAARLVAAQPTAERRASWWKPVAGAAAVLAAVGVWPLLMHAIHARGVTQTFSPASRWAYRARVTYDGMAPYLHVVLLAVPVALVGGLALRRVRRRGGLANDAWAWAGISGGLFTVVATLVTGTVAIVPWVQGSAHRTTEFPALVAWWILAVWAVVGLSAPAAARLDDPSPGRGAPAAGEEEEEADGGRDELERLVAR